MKFNFHKHFWPLLFRIFRSRRMQSFSNQFSLNASTRILDVGGTEFNWNLIDVKPNVFFCNLSAPKNRSDKIWLIADGRNLPFKDRAFDITYSNSVIEHLGNLEAQLQFAAECRRVGKKYYIQTPNKYFPVEPHYLAVGLHWLPKKIQVTLLRNFSLHGIITRPTREQSEALVAEINLLDKNTFASMFPDGEIWNERFLLMVKSWMAVKS